MWPVDNPRQKPVECARLPMTGGLSEDFVLEMGSLLPCAVVACSALNGISLVRCSNAYETPYFP